MSQNPFHSQDSIFRFGLNDNLIATPNTLQDNSIIINDTTSLIDQEVFIEEWLQRSASLSCCSICCMQNIHPTKLTDFKEKFQSMDKHEQESFIKGILLSCQKEQRQDRKVFEYTLFPLGKLCRKAFCHLVSMSNQKLQNIINSMDLKWTRRIHGNKDKIFLHAFTFDQKESILNWIKTFADQNGEPRPGRLYIKIDRTRRIRDTDILWLPADLTISKLHGIYSRDNDTLNINVETFRKYFKLCETIKIKSGKSDVCDTCTVFREQLNVPELSESSSITLTTDFQLHLRQAKLARLDYKNDHTRLGFTHLSFDFSQNLSLPQLHDQPSDLYFMSLLNINLFGIHNETHHRQMNYIYREDQGKKASNNVATLLLDYIYCLPKEQRLNLILHADNCVGQNKNNTILKLLSWLCLLGKCNTIEFKFMMKGHTKFSPDSCFGHIKKKFARENVYTLNQLKSVVETSSVTNECKIFPGHRFKDYRSKLDLIFEDISGIAKYHVFVFNSEHPGVVYCKKLVNDANVIEFETLIEDDLSQNDYLFVPDPLEPSELTERKKRDINRVLRYIPEDFHTFYN
eukprot:NODE_636_length_5742_cov_0.129364.p1 type:complete len:572 gc:universal NODE_636_length_5742_cov_0.129364:942-2657(+)